MTGIIENYTIQDILGLFVAVAAFGVVFVLPAIALAQVTDAFGFRRLRTAGTFGLALLVGYAVLPVADSLLCRWFDLGAALSVNLALAVYGVYVLWLKGLPRPSGRMLVACLAALGVLAAVWVDVDRDGGLYLSLLAIDAVKHAATVRSLVESGSAPPIDPSFLRDDPAGYYYYFYVLSALAERLCGGLIDSRAAVGGQIFWTGIALVTLAGLVFRKARFGTGRFRVPFLLLLMAVAGLQLLFVIRAFFAMNAWVAQINWLNDQVASWPTLLVWVPHHVAAFIACWTGFLLLGGLTEHSDIRRRRDACALALAGVAFASALGLSIWVTLGAVVTVAAWLVVLAAERRWRAALMVVGAGVMALVVALPDLVDLLRFRAPGPFPIAIEVRFFMPVESVFEPGFARQFARLLSLPLNYLFEFGALLVGAGVFWHQRFNHRPWHHGEVARLITISALAGLALASFFRSTIFNNDLGWRVVMFAQLAMLLWTLAALGPAVRAPQLLTFLRVCRRRVPVSFVAALGLGLAGTVYDLVGLRAFDPRQLDDVFHREASVAPVDGEVRAAQVDREVRAAYGWLAARTGDFPVVQHNPDDTRPFSYGLYSRSRAAVSDRLLARLYGSAEADITQRIDEINPIFATAMPVHEAWRRLRLNHVDAVLVTANDAVWRDRASWVWANPPLYASDHVRILAVGGGDS